MVLDLPAGCSLSTLNRPMIKLESLRVRLSNIKSELSSEWGTLKKVRVSPNIPLNSSFPHQSMAYLHAGTSYIKEVSELLKVGLTALGKTPSYEAVQETYSCLLRLKISCEEDAVRLQPGSGETHLFLPDGLGDDLIVEVLDSKGKNCGRVVAQVVDVADDPGNKLRWWCAYNEPEHELVGRIQLWINYSTSFEENSHLKIPFIRYGCSHTYCRLSRFGA